jgi:hypothetical protein
MGRERSLAELKTCHSAKELVDNVEYACITTGIYDLLCDWRARATIRATIAEVLGLPQIADIFYDETKRKGA